MHRCIYGNTPGFLKDSIFSISDAHNVLPEILALTIFMYHALTVNRLNIFLHHSVWIHYWPSYRFNFSLTPFLQVSFHGINYRLSYRFQFIDFITGFLTGFSSWNSLPDFLQVSVNGIPCRLSDRFHFVSLFSRGITKMYALNGTVLISLSHSMP